LQAGSGSLADTVLEKHGAEKATVYLLAELVASVDEVRDVLLDIYKQGGFSQKA
jgi:hypothetical protein